MAEAGATPTRVTREMSISREEFLRLLSVASCASAIHETDGGWRLARAEGSVAVRFEALPPLAIGSLALPRARVTLEFPPAAAWAARFVERFDLYYRRGGG